MTHKKTAARLNRTAAHHANIDALIFLALLGGRNASVRKPQPELEALRQIATQCRRRAPLVRTATLYRSFSAFASTNANYLLDG